MGKPPLPHSAQLAKSPLTELVSSKSSKFWQESLKSQASTVSHGSTGSKISSSSSQAPPLPDMNNLEFTSPKAGVYRPINSAASRGAKKDKCSLM